MRVSPAQLPAQLVRGLAAVYAVAGEEPLLIVEAVDAIRAAAAAAGCGEREVLDAERDFDWGRLLEACATGSLFTERRLIELRLGPGAPGEAGTAALKRLAATPPADAVLLVVAGKLDGRSRSGGWYAALEAAGVGVYCWSVGTADFPRWLTARASAAGLQLEADALQLLAARTEGNLLAAAQEIARLALLYPRQRVDTATVLAAVGDAAHYEAFDWNDRLLAGDAAGTVRGLYRLRAEAQALPALIGALAWDLRQLARAADAPPRVPRARLAAFTAAARRGAPRRVGNWLARLAEIDAGAKSSGGQAAAWEALLALGLEISGVPRRAR